jgi:molybdenum cofactor guanylyltransferase
MAIGTVIMMGGIHRSSGVIIPRRWAEGSRRRSMTGIILSGGSSRRMGENKAFLRVGGERMIDRTVRLFRTLFREVLIVTVNPLDYLDQEAAIVTDIIPGKGALGGLYTGLFYSGDEYAFAAACDMPFLNGAFIEYMVARATGYDIVVPSLPDGLQPLHAIYSRRLLPLIRARLDRNLLKIAGFYPGQRILTISPDTVHPFDPAGRMFLNINTPRDVMNLPAGNSGPADEPGLRVQEESETR